MGTIASVNLASPIVPSILWKPGPDRERSLATFPPTLHFAIFWLRDDLRRDRWRDPAKQTKLLSSFGIDLLNGRSAIIESLLLVVVDISSDFQIRIGINTYRERYSASGSSGRIWPALCESLNSSRTSPSFPSAFRKSMM
jgi:hypothetical protein